MMIDRFILEQKLIKMFEVVEDIRMINEYIGDERLDAIASVWEMKIEDMWQTFEAYVKDDFKKKKGTK